jgi:hypothetical protein
VHAELESGLSFVAYTYAGELPSCAFGFNSHGVVRFPECILRCCFVVIFRALESVDELF